MADEVDLPIGWTATALGNLGKIVTGKTPSTKIAENFGGNIPFITPSDMDGRRIIVETGRCLTEQGASSVSGCRIPKGAVMVSCIGSDMGKTAIAGRKAVTNQQINSIIVEPANSSLFVYYNLSNRKTEFQYLASGGSAQPILNKGHFSELSISLPPLKEQQAIACILATLDDRIELIHRMNRTLEEMTQAIFESWFVEFGPVIARSAGEQPPGLASDIADLFPNAFDSSDNEEIPHGWSRRPIGDLVRVVGGGTPSTKEPVYWEGGVHPFCTPKDMSSLTSTVLLHTERHLTDEGLAKVNSGQLPPGTVLLSSRAPIGYLAIAETPVSINQGIIAMVCDRELPNLYVLHWTQANMDRVIANANGSTFLEISKQNFRPIKALVPSKNLLDHFSRITGPIYRRLVGNLHEVGHLVAIRDALLPRLLSGELLISDAERIIGRCA